MCVAIERVWGGRGAGSRTDYGAGEWGGGGGEERAERAEGGGGYSGVATCGWPSRAHSS
jgi:hypothetical protein